MDCLSLTVTPSQLTQFLTKSISAKLPVLIKGAPGIGKTDIVGQATQIVNGHLITKHPVVDSPIDYKGLGFKLEGRDEAAFLPFGDLAALIKADRLTICFLDDLGQAPPAVQAAVMQLLLARRINGHKVSDHVCFVAATNRKMDMAGVTGLLEPVKSRFATILELVPDHASWIKWALANGMPPLLIAFMRYRPKYILEYKASKDLTNSPSPRTIANAGKLINMGIPEGIEYPVIGGAVGQEMAADMVGFMRIFARLPNPMMVLNSPDSAPIPADAGELYALVSALAHHGSKQTVSNLFRYAQRLPEEFTMLLITDVVRMHPELAQTNEYVQWSIKNQDNLML